MKMKHAHLILAFVTTLMIGACGGGGGGVSTPNSYVPPSVAALTGVAAIGNPIVGGAVQLKCAGGTTLSSTTSTTGTWTIALSEQIAPCAVQVSGGAINGAPNSTHYHSIVTNLLATVNVTPLTDLIVANLAGTATPDVWFAGLNGAALSSITVASTNSSISNLRSAFNGLAPLSTFNPIYQIFQATPGGLGDDILAALQIAMTNTGISHATLLAAAAAPNISSAAVTTLNAALPAAYSSTISGSKPTVTSMNPTSGPAGTVVTITGNNFVTASSPKPVVVLGASTVTLISYSATQLSFEVPTHWLPGAYNLTVTQGSRVSFYSTPFTITGVVSTTGSTATGTTTTTGSSTLPASVGTQMGGSRQGSLLASPSVVTTLAGSGAYQYLPTNGFGISASFKYPSGITTDGTNLFVADHASCLIRKIVIATGEVTTLAGSGTASPLESWCPLVTVDGIGTAASFYGPLGITTDGTNLYVTDVSTHFSITDFSKIRKIVIATGEVTTLAGSGAPGSVDGTGVAASFNHPMGITTDGTNLYVSDTNNDTIRKIVIATGTVSTIAGSIVSCTPTMSSLDCHSGADGIGAAASFYAPKGITTDGTNLYVADMGTYRIRKIAIATGAVTTLAGQYGPGIAGGGYGAVDGIGTTAKFATPVGITTDGANLYVVDEGENSTYFNARVRKVVISSGEVTTLAGSSTSFGAVDGIGAAASFYHPQSITTDGMNLYVADKLNNKVRRLAAVPAVTSTNPSTGIAGTAVSISGSGFDITPANNTVSFNGTQATVTAATTTSLSVNIPNGATTGIISVTTAAGGTSITSAIFTVGAPTLTSMSSSTGIAGTSVTITGTNFDVTPANNTVTFNGNPATVTTSTATSITTSVPSSATTGSVSVTTAGGTVTAPNSFSVGAPTVTSMTPSTGSAGTTVTLTGTNFDVTPANNTVRFGGTQATVTASTATSITAYVPSGATTGSVSVATAGGTGASAGSFTLSCPNDPLLVGTWMATSGVNTSVMTITSCQVRQTISSNGCSGTYSYTTSGGVLTGTFTQVSSSTCGTVGTVQTFSYSLSGTTLYVQAADGLHPYLKQ